MRQKVALVHGSNLWVANMGDSRWVALRWGTALALTQDHKPNDPKEMQHIIDVGPSAGILPFCSHSYWAGFQSEQRTAMMRGMRFCLHPSC